MRGMELREGVLAGFGIVSVLNWNNFTLCPQEHVDKNHFDLEIFKKRWGRRRIDPKFHARYQNSKSLVRR
jgi:hypothetical protein